MKVIKRFLSVLLVMCMMISMVPMTTLAAETNSTDTMTAETTQETMSTDSNDFYRIFHLDCGRKYFTVDQIKAIIDNLAANNYTHMELAFGNGGLRFLLDDMEITVGETTYSSEAVTSGIKAGNSYFAEHDGYTSTTSVESDTCLTQTEMNNIISYANEKGIEIIPLLNSPGHMNAVVYAMGQLGISTPGYIYNTNLESVSTIDITDATVVGFSKALVQKYITYFADKGCQLFNLGADEFTNDPTDQEVNGAKGSFNDSMKSEFIAYVNAQASAVTAAGMTPMMFNDGYYWTNAGFNSDIIVCYWEVGNLSSATIAGEGHKIINTNKNWYYVLGSPFGDAQSNWCSYAWATNGVNKVPVTTMVDGNNVGDNLVGAMMCLWCDDTSEIYIDTEESNVATLIRTLAANNSTYFTVASDNGSDGSENEEETVPEERTITVVVNGTATDTIEGVAVSGDCATDNSAIATAVATTTTVDTSKLIPITSLNDIVSGGEYLIVEKDGTVLTANSGAYNNNSSLLALRGTATVDNTDVWTITKNGDYYNISYGTNGYLTFDTNTASVDPAAENITLTYSDGYWQIQANGDYLNDFGDAEQAAGGWPEYDQNANWYIYQIVEAGTDTVVTFTGKSIGTTNAEIGGVNYTIIVTEEDISNVILTYHPWLSTYSVHPEGTGASNCNDPGIAVSASIAATATDVYSEQGTDISTLVATTGDWRWEEDAQTVYWKATVLAEGYHQENNQETDRSMSGTDFTYIRYWDGVWSYSSDRENWTAIKSTDEVCVYYLQETEVTVEVDTFVKDWAFTTKSAGGKDESKYQKALSFAVVYADGTMNPSEEDIYAESTLIYWDNLANLGFIRVGVNEVYQVEKITYTFGERVTTSTSTNWSTEDSIAWEKTTVGDVTWYDETVCWDESYGTEPVVNGADLEDEIYAGTPQSGTTNYNGTWGADDAVLILIYLKPVETEDSLNVVYYDEKFNDTLYSYTINVEHGKNFTNSILNSDGDIEAPPAFVHNNERIDVTGYGIKNVADVVRYFQTDLTKVPDAIGKYNSSLYTYTGSVISEDGKTLYLYYNINTEALSPNFVVDFGLPFTFDLNQVTNRPELVNSVTASARYGTLAYDDSTKTFTYTPTTILRGIDVLSINIVFDGATSATTTNVGVTPATTVFYEESFLTYGDGWIKGTAPTVKQTTEVLGEHKYNYGYDPVYADDATGSNGSKAESTATGASASFTFTGAGFELYANSDSASGYVTVYSQGELSKLYMIDTALTAGDTAATNQQTDGTYYSLPIISEMDLPYGTYTVQIKQTNGEAPIYIDGVRIINTIDESSLTDFSNSVYYADKEDNPVFYELRDYVLNAIDVEILNESDYISSEDRVGMVDAVEDLAGQVYNALNVDDAAVIIHDGTTFTETLAQDLLDNGPKNELYLYPGQTLAFKVTTSRVMQLGLKSPTGSANFDLTVNDSEVTYKANEDDETGTTLNSISSTVDMFYKIANKATDQTEYIVEISVKSGVLSVTDLKICDDPNATFTALTQDDIEAVLLDMYGLAEELVVYADATLNIAVNDEDGNALATTQLTANGIEGEEATFVAADIQAAVEALELPDKYNLSDTTYSDVTVVYGEEDSVAFVAEKELTTEEKVVEAVKEMISSITNLFKKWFRW